MHTHRAETKVESLRPPPPRPTNVQSIFASKELSLCVDDAAEADSARALVLSGEQEVPARVGLLRRVRVRVRVRVGEECPRARTRRRRGST